MFSKYYLIIFSEEPLLSMDRACVASGNNGNKISVGLEFENLPGDGSVQRLLPLNGEVH